jgi:hypothetical protein
MWMKLIDQTRDEAEEKGATNSRQSVLQGGQGDRGRGSGLWIPAHDNGTFCLCLSNYLSRRRGELTADPPASAYQRDEFLSKQPPCRSPSVGAGRDPLCDHRPPTLRAAATVEQTNNLRRRTCSCTTRPRSRPDQDQTKTRTMAEANGTLASANGTVNTAALSNPAPAHAAFDSIADVVEAFGV